MIGPAYWTDMDVTELGIYLDGRWIDGGRFYPQPFGIEAAAPGSVMPTLGHSDVVQYRWLGADVPVNLEPYVATGMLVEVVEEADYRALLAAGNRGAVVDLWCDIPIVDQWSIAHKASGQTTWKSSRQFPWALGGVTHVTRPPMVLIDGVEQTLVSSAGPAAGEVYVPEEGGLSAIETPADISGEWLQLWYSPILRVRVDSARIEIAQHNRVIVSLAISEIRERLFEVAA